MSNDTTTQTWLRRAATARPSARRIRLVTDRDIVTRYVPRLAGRNVHLSGGPMWYDTRAEAVEAARRVRNRIAAEAKMRNDTTQHTPADHPGGDMSERTMEKARQVVHRLSEWYFAEGGDNDPDSPIDREDLYALHEMVRTAEATAEMERRQAGAYAAVAAVVRRELEAPGAPADVRERVTEPTQAQIDDACMWYRHDFGLLSEKERDSVRFEARQWFRAWGKALSNGDDPAALLRTPRGEGCRMVDETYCATHDCGAHDDEKCGRPGCQHCDAQTVGDRHRLSRHLLALASVIEDGGKPSNSVADDVRRAASALVYTPPPHAMRQVTDRLASLLDADADWLHDEALAGRLPDRCQAVAERIRAALLRTPRGEGEDTIPVSALRSEIARLRAHRLLPYLAWARLCALAGGEPVGEDTPAALRSEAQGDGPVGAVCANRGAPNAAIAGGELDPDEAVCSVECYEQLRELGCPQEHGGTYRPKPARRGEGGGG